MSIYYVLLLYMYMYKIVLSRYTYASWIQSIYIHLLAYIIYVIICSYTTLPMYSIHAICYTYNNIRIIPKYNYMQPCVGIIYYIIFNSWRFLLLTPVLNLISCCCNGFAHCHRHCTVLLTRRGRHLVITINVYDIRIIHV